MSLVAWYPLNNSVKNQGVLDLELTQVTAPAYGDGKVTPKALTTGAFKWTATQAAKVFNNDAFSYSCWFKNLAEASDTTNRAMIFGSNSPRVFSLFQYDTAGKLHLSWYANGKDTTGGTLSTVIADVFPKNTWVHICVTYSSKLGTHVYINGVQKYENLTFKMNCTDFAKETQVIYNSSYHILNDVRIYNHCLSLKEVKELANMTTSLGISIDNTGNFYATKFEETTNNKFEKGNTVKTAHFMENYITEPDGAVFQQIAFHLDPTSYKFASTDNFNDCYKDCRRWFNAKICDLADKWEFLLIQRATESATTYKTRWSQTKNPNSATYEDVVAAQVTKNTSTGYTNYSDYGGVYKFNSYRYYCFANQTKGNSFGIGHFGNAWYGGCPGYGGIAIKDGGYQSLYIRIDNLSDTALKKIHAQIKKNTNTIIANQFYEFI